MTTDHEDGGTDGANRQVNSFVATKLLCAAGYQNRYMDRESADGTRRSIDRFIESEMIISERFIASVWKMFGDDYKTIIRNLSREYEKQIIKYPSGDMDMTNMTDVERLQLLFECGVSVDDTKAELAEDKLIRTTRHYRRHLGKDVREKIGISAARAGPVGICNLPGTERDISEGFGWAEGCLRVR
ncbi:MAG: hypothetical protein C4B59_07660 [Candidatus Methanogaster sp.]|uniref:Uncharacterized protein n=1 Tax=Candidatus Methanogaster sp. TaxID=3386292 RepID=A0AC61L3C0_9EURY|nr:MAG: hypothetical protein C4B59_07660 [ANME-2 cluster archaeon]